MMTRPVARRFCGLREVYSLIYGRCASGKNGDEDSGNWPPALGQDQASRLINYPG